MAFQLGDDTESGMHDINLIPLIDIMLVLMIIFLVTATVMNPAVPLTLPSTEATPQVAPAKMLEVSVLPSGALFLDGKPSTLEAIKAAFKTAATQTVKPSIELRADQNTKYAIVAEVLGAASAQGLNDIALVSALPVPVNP